MICLGESAQAVQSAGPTLRSRTGGFSDLDDPPDNRNAEP